MSNKALNHKNMSVPFTAKLQFENEKVHLNVTLQLDLCMGGVLTRVNKRAGVGKRKKLICDKFALGLKVQFGVSWVCSLLPVSVMKYCKAHFPAQVSQGNRLQKPL